MYLDIYSSKTVCVSVSLFVSVFLCFFSFLSIYYRIDQITLPSHCWVENWLLICVVERRLNQLYLTFICVVIFTNCNNNCNVVKMYTMTRLFDLSELSTVLFYVLCCFASV